MAKKIWVQAKSTDIVEGAKIRVKFENERSKPLVFGTVTAEPVVRKRGDIIFRLDLGDDCPPLTVRHGDYTHTIVSVEVDQDKRCTQYMAAIKRSYKRQDPTHVFYVVGGPFDGQPWTCTIGMGNSSLPFTVNSVTGHYEAGRWVAH